MALAKPGDLLLAFALLSRLPMPEQSDWGRQAQAAWAYPIVGAVLGLIAGIVGLLFSWVGVPPTLVGFVTLAVMIILSGAMHEDGLADCADGFWGGFDQARRLEIMKDSHIGSYGVIALILSLGMRWVAFWLLWEAGTMVAFLSIVVSAAGSRAAMPWLMSMLPHARSDGLSHSVGKVDRKTSLVASGIAILVGFICLGTEVIWPIISVAAVTLICRAIARSKIGGQTGDVLGATQQISEIAILSSILA